MEIRVLRYFVTVAREENIIPDIISDIISAISTLPRYHIHCYNLHQFYP